ncbi:serine hydrolase domain-containing protein [Aurantiacibacter rhizosphaerae]|uniref:Serine hydrolase n=1 Tax=Aurantiacibacter rhizosphaerae TaxID=2691582 RepID=A0A844XCX8_9SPHN|nr:serine hydrolase [Aurantiacibacter rhizosphaerae]MWV28391.1 serine hydrolase [Aurantiacibacter rhizosphaerae]
MIRTAFLAATALSLAIPATSPVFAQAISQEEMQQRYDRALAAGYKALFLCSAIANAERNGGTRTPESVMKWELTGIQSPLDDIVEDLPYAIVRRGQAETVEDAADISSADGYVQSASIVHRVEVEWADDTPARMAIHTPGAGCALQPIGSTAPEIGEQVFAVTQASAEPVPSAPADSALEIVSASAFDATYGEDSRTTAILVMRDGTVLDEEYLPDFGPDVPQRTWSVAKSIAATLVGAAVQRGEASVGDPAGLGAGEGDPRAAITIDHALRMASGRYSDTIGSRTDPLYYGGATVEERATDWPLVHMPGASWRYANNDTLMAIRAMRDGFEAHPPADFFRQVGMLHTVAETDWQGNYILSSQVWSTAHDLARLGQLYLNDGVLPDGTRLLPEGWVQYVSAPSGPQPDGEWGYGAGWWIMSGMDGIPDDAFAALGNRGQYVVVIPSKDVVIVRRGEDPAGGSGFDIAAFTRDVLAALGK